MSVYPPLYIQISICIFPSSPLNLYPAIPLSFLLISVKLITEQSCYWAMYECVHWAKLPISNCSFSERNVMVFTPGRWWNDVMLNLPSMKSVGFRLGQSIQRWISLELGHFGLRICFYMIAYNAGCNNINASILHFVIFNNFIVSCRNEHICGVFLAIITVNWKHATRSIFHTSHR